MYYSQRTQGDKIRVNENINFTFWKKLTHIFEEMYNKDFFTKEYPVNFPVIDNPYDTSFDQYGGCTYDCNAKALSEDLAFFIGDKFFWPLQTRKKLVSEEIGGDSSQNLFEDWRPSEAQVFDLIEFLYSKTNSVRVHISYHDEHFRDSEEIKTLSFPRNDNSAKIKFAKMINDLLRNGRMIYEFDLESGQIKTILNAQTKQLINSALNCVNFKFDSEYNQMLQIAFDQISSSRLEQNYQAIKNLWAAFERLKCYFRPKNQDDKINSINKILALFSDSDMDSFRKEVNSEMKNLTTLGNNFLIRHSETYCQSLIDRNQVNYLFNRCLLMINLIQDQIVATEKQYVTK